MERKLRIEDYGPDKDDDVVNEKNRKIGERIVRVYRSKHNGEPFRHQYSLFLSILDEVKDEFQHIFAINSQKRMEKRTNPGYERMVSTFGFVLKGFWVLWTQKAFEKRFDSVATLQGKKKYLLSVIH